eukprot:CAMPEP_0198562708 /NCGR_PEP_ID=MMETSP1462-20131121/97593_1 /TAXON_ID=1333877 /ORGANISM="Brandtodinium nutriculum, Strain RCC3387" /LENGTH=173 /DNA_ID=CAMNT_0044293641 /DNA_START=9 /DNA_END=531 /DNA_ORIENTATION=-
MLDLQDGQFGGAAHASMRLHKDTRWSAQELLLGFIRDNVQFSSDPLTCKVCQQRFVGISVKRGPPPCDLDPRDTVQGKLAFVAVSVTTGLLVCAFLFVQAIPDRRVGYSVLGCAAILTCFACTRLGFLHREAARTGRLKIAPKVEVCDALEVGGGGAIGRGLNDRGAQAPVAP